MNGRRKPTMDDVAKLAGVSYATVERVLNGRGGVSRTKEASVLDAARKLKIDRALQEVSTRWLRVAIVTPKPTTPYYAALQHGFELAQKSFETNRVLCHVTFFDDLEPESLATVIGRAAQKADAMIVVAYEHPLVVDAVSRVARHIPVVTVASDLPDSGRLAYVGVDNRCAGRIAGELMGRFIGREGGKVIVIAGLHAYVGHEERDGAFRAVLRRRFPACEVVASLESHEDERSTEKLTRDAFRRYSDLRGIYNISVGDEGIARALRAIKREHATIVIGHELNASSRQLLIEGCLDAVLDQSPFVQAVRAVEVILGHYNRGTASGLPLQTPISIYLRENLPLEG
ncbi:LacI family DNA-binding transcriptional regulator [Paraburkholderia phymatum]|uniref:Transcriptional regulator, LacI family n=1 Tax=Paraburkholderia phymatum (strain DSM 17167 / CIP 108236 / LMG 21445 / STM815) TaxID=391038 RepID=B2JT97_PARP8|nr:LacI family DNA-binding transcriptional regulator [Paraburkholderia phymatum]ACC75800.1 transcriptional regulator, LacI family [Paraburkholderia phymatum STM815]